MRQRAFGWLAVGVVSMVLVFVMAAQPSHAAGRTGGGHGGGAHPGWSHAGGFPQRAMQPGGFHSGGGGFNHGGFHHGGFHHHGHFGGTRVFFGFGFGYPFFGFPYYGYPFYPYYAYGYPYPYSGYPAYGSPAYTAPVAAESPGYVQPGQPGQQQYWYYCRESQAYYPYVKDCPSAWLQVVPQPSQ